MSICAVPNGSGPGGGPNYASRRTPIGPEKSPQGGYHLRTWAPKTRSLAVERISPAGEVVATIALNAEPGGYFSGPATGLQAGEFYKLKTDEGSFPDPASRFQPQGPHGPSQIVESEFRWTDSAWKGLPPEQLVVYEMHLGTFSAEGTWAGAERQIPELARIGITCLEIMPIAEFPGSFGWGYDGVCLFAPCRLYGSPDDARRFINRAHELGIAVILDVVYNHIGPDGNYFARFAEEYFSKRYGNEWGQALNFDGEQSAPVREFFITNGCYWIGEFHFDGLRFDATQQIFDASPRHVLAEMSERLRATAGDRQLFLVAENESQNAQVVRPVESGGHGLDAIWNDDFHHAAYVAGTGRNPAYYSDYRGSGQEFVSVAKRGFLYQGQWHQWQKKRRGTPTTGLNARNFVIFLENHDQVANSLRGLRMHQLCSPPKFRALTAMMLLLPGIPMLFQGQEFAASAPFLYFADVNADLQKLVAEGRHGFLRQFPCVDAAVQQGFALDVPHDPGTFHRCRLDFRERERHAPAYRLHADLLRLRREDPAIAAAGPVDGAALTAEVFVLRYFHPAGDRLLIVNLGPALHYHPAPEPLLAPMADRGWRVEWSSENPAYGGSGTPALETTSNWMFPAECTLLLITDEPTDLPAAKLSEKD